MEPDEELALAIRLLPDRTIYELARAFFIWGAWRCLENIEAPCPAAMGLYAELERSSKILQTTLDPDMWAGSVDGALSWVAGLTKRWNDDREDVAPRPDRDQEIMDSMVRQLFKVSGVSEGGEEE